MTWPFLFICVFLKTPQWIPSNGFKSIACINSAISRCILNSNPITKNWALKIIQLLKYDIAFQEFQTQQCKVNCTCESRSLALEKFCFSSSAFALFLNARTSTLFLHIIRIARIFPGEQTHRDLSGGLMMTPSGSTARLKPPLHLPKHTHNFTMTFGEARPVRVFRVWNEPCFR